MMRNFQQKRGWRNVIESWPVLIVLGILVLVFAWGVKDFTEKMLTTRTNKETARQKLRELTEKKEMLSLDIAKLNTESGIEENIREKFGLGKDGEGLIVVVEDKNKPVVVEEKSNWFISFWKNLFK